MTQSWVPGFATTEPIEEGEAPVVVERAAAGKRTLLEGDRGPGRGKSRDRRRKAPGKRSLTGTWPVSPETRADKTASDEQRGAVADARDERGEQPAPHDAHGDQPAQRGARGDQRDARGEDLARARRALQSVAGAGRPLPAELATRFSALLGVDLSDVTLHDDSGAHAAAAELGARAFATGTRVAFARGAWSPETPAGLRLLAHELVHVAQQKGAGSAALAAKRGVGESSSAIEREADEGAAALAAGQAFTVQRHGALPAISLLNDGPDGGVPDAGLPPGGLPGGVPGNAPGGGGNGGGNGGGDARGGERPPGGTPDGGVADGGTRDGGTPGNVPGNPPGGTRDGGTPGNQPDGGRGPDGGAGPRPDGQPTGGNPALAPGPDGHTGAATYESTLDAKIAEILNQRADPAQKAFFEMAFGRADAMRLASAQFVYTPRRLGQAILNTFIPVQEFQEHARTGFSQNPYASGSGLLAGIQTGIEGLRGIIRLLGDVVAIVQSVSSTVALVTGLIGLIPGCQPVLVVTAVATAITEAASVVQICIQLIDILIGIVQMILLIVRAWTTKDPGERARIAQLMRKEAGDITRAAIRAVTEAAMMLLGAAAGSVGRGVKGGLQNMARSFSPKGLIRTVTRAVTTRGLGHVARQTASRLAVKDAAKTYLKTIEGRIGQRVTAQNIPTIAVALRIDTRGLQRALRTGGPSFGLTNILNGAMRAHLRRPIIKALKAAPAKATRGAISGGRGGARREPRVGAGDAGHGDPGTLDRPHTANTVLGTVSYWPDVLEQANDTREDVQQGNERMKSMYDHAREDLDPATRAAVDAAVGKVEQKGSRIRVIAGEQRTGAQADQQQAQQGTAHAQRGRETQGQARDRAREAERGARTAEGPARDAANRVPRVGGSLVSRIVDATIGRVGRLLGSIQSAVQDFILKIAYGLAGIDGDDLDLAGIDRSMTWWDGQSQQAQGDSAEAEAQSAEFQATMFRLKDGKSRAEQDAIQGMADSMAFMQVMDEWDQWLANEIQQGDAYITEVTPTIQAELATRESPAAVNNDENQDHIDEAYTAPVRASVTEYKAGLDNRPDLDQAVGDAAVDAAVAELREVVGGDVGQTEQAWRQGVTTHIGQVRALVTTHKSNVDAKLATAEGFRGGRDFEGYRNAVLEVEAAMNGFWAEEREIMVHLQSELQGGDDEWAAEINRVIAEESPAPSGGGGGDDADGGADRGGGNGNGNGGSPDGGVPDGGVPDGGPPSGGLPPGGVPDAGAPPGDAGR